MHTEFWWRNLTRVHLENLGLIGRIILNWLIGSRMGADWINGAADTDKWWAVVKAVMNLWALWNVGNFLTSWETVSFSGRTHDVTHWTHVLDSVTLKDPLPSPNQNKLPTLYRHVHPDWNTATGLANFRTALHNITVCLSTCSVALIKRNPSKIITIWGSLTHNWQWDVVLHRCSRYTGFVKCITFLLHFLAPKLLIGRQKLFHGTTGQSSRTSLWKPLAELEAKIKDLGWDAKRKRFGSR